MSETSNLATYSLQIKYIFNIYYLLIRSLTEVPLAATLLLSSSSRKSKVKTQRTWADLFFLGTRTTSTTTTTAHNLNKQKNVSWCFLTLPYVSWHNSTFFNISHHFSMFLYVSQCFSMFLYVSLCFSMFLSVSWCFLTFLDVSWCFLMFLDDSGCFLTFLDVSWHFLMFLDISWHFLMFLDLSLWSKNLNPHIQMKQMICKLKLCKYNI